MDCGPILLYAPKEDALSMGLYFVGVGVGFVYSFFVPSPSSWFGMASVGSCMYCISRDMQIPMAALLPAVLPVCVLNFSGNMFSYLVLFSACIVEIAIGETLKRPTGTWLPPLLAFLCMAGDRKHVFYRLLYVILSLVPYKIRILYGILLALHTPISVAGFDALAGPALVYTLFAMLAQFEWFFIVLILFWVLFNVGALYIFTNTQLKKLNASS